MFFSADRKNQNWILSALQEPHSKMISPRSIVQMLNGLGDKTDPCRTSSINAPGPAPQKSLSNAFCNVSAKVREA